MAFALFLNNSPSGPSANLDYEVVLISEQASSRMEYEDALPGDSNSALHYPKASTIVQFRMEGKNGAIISTREKGEPARHSPPWWSASVLSDFAAPALLPITPQVSKGRPCNERHRTLSD